MNDPRVFVDKVDEIDYISTAAFDRRFLDDTGDFIFRYNLTREWKSGGEGKVVFCMLNGSTASAHINDPTVRRCMIWTRKWGYKVLEVVNLFGFRSVDPKKMKAAKDPIGPLNDQYIYDAAKGASLIVCAWGTHGAFNGRGRHVKDTILNRMDLHYLNLTKGGHPGHPLYLLGDSKPIPWKTI